MGQDPPEGEVHDCFAEPPGLVATEVSASASDRLVTANGATAAVIGTAAVVEHWTDHAEHHPTASEQARDLLERLVVGVKVDGVGTWLDTVPVDAAGYEPGTGIVRLEQRVGDVGVVTRAVAPLQADAGADLLVHVEVSTDSAAQVEVWVTSDVRPGGDDLVDGESATGGTDAIVEARGEDTVVHRPLPPAAHVLAAPGEPALAGDLDDRFEAGDDVRVTFQWPAVVLGPADRTVAALALSASDGAWLEGADPDALLDAERQLWSAWEDEETLPAGLDDDQLAVARQATATLRMAALRDGPVAGGLLGALEPGGRNQLFTRDAAFGAVALARTGHTEEAHDALAALLAAETGAFADDLGLESYGVPLSHAEGDGAEASDSTDCPGGGSAGIDASIDTLGWFLWAFAALDPSDPWVDEARPSVRDEVLEPLVALVDETTARLPADGGFWGRHWTDCPPEGRQAHSTSAIAAIVGIRAAAQPLGTPEHLDTADLLLRGLLDTQGPLRLDERGEDEICPVLLSSPEEACEGCDPLDAMVAEIVASEVVDPTGPLARATVAELLDGLKVGDGPGVRATDDADDPAAPDRPEDLRESVTADLRLAVALHAMGETDSARVLLARVTAAARANHDRIPEALSEDGRGEARGALPLVGLGAGAYLLALDALQGG